jgi:hypothetical protein
MYINVYLDIEIETWTYTLKILILLLMYERNRSSELQSFFCLPPFGMVPRKSHVQKVKVKRSPDSIWVETEPISFHEMKYCWLLS